MPIIPFEYTYLAATIPALVVWVVFFFLRKDLRKEMLMMSLGIAFLNLVTAYLWWGVDWWSPPTLTGTRVGIEDFITGFASGGVMAVAYEVIFRKRHIRLRQKCDYCPRQSTLIILLGLLTAFLFWIAEFSLFNASAVALLVVAGILFYFRKDLFFNGVISGVLTLLISIPSYVVIQMFSPGWIAEVYLFETLSGVLALGVPIEEFVFWFLAGFVFGPFYEYWKGERLRKM